MSNLSKSINLLFSALEAIPANAISHEEAAADANDLDNLLRPCLEGEHVARQLFALDRENQILADPYFGMFDAFDLPVQAWLARPRNWDERNHCWYWQGNQHLDPQKYLLAIDSRLRRTRGTPSIVEGLANFREAFEIFSGGALSGITNWNNIVVAGGSVLACLTTLLSNPSRTKLTDIFHAHPYKNSDIDLFLWGLTEEQAKQKMEEIFDVLNASAARGAICFRTKNTITIQAEFPKRPVQIVMRLYMSPAEILCGFDIDCCCVCYNGTNVFTNPRGLMAITRQCNTINLSRRSPSYEHRLMKYSVRGYEVSYPELDRKKVNYRRLADPNRTVFPKGLGRLIVYEIMRSNYTYFPALYEESGPAPSATPVSIQNLRHSNYDYAWCKIPYGEDWYDPRKVRDHIKERAVEIVSSFSYDCRRDRHDPPLHFHAITFGSMKYCLNHCCLKRHSEAEGCQLHSDLPSAAFRGPVQFIVNDPGRQLAGSFTPIFSNSDDWEASAYQADNDRNRLDEEEEDED